MIKDLTLHTAGRCHPASFHQRGERIRHVDRAGHLRGFRRAPASPSRLDRNRDGAAPRIPQPRVPGGKVRR